MPSLTTVDMMNRTSMAAPKKKNWVKAAVPKERRGVFKAKAERAGKSTAAFAKEHEADSGTLGKEARLAQTLSGMSHKRKKKSPLYDRSKG